MATPAMLTNTETTFGTFKESWPKNAPIKRVNNPEVDDKTVVLATLVRRSAAFDKYCKIQATKKTNQARLSIETIMKPPSFQSTKSAHKPFICLIWGYNIGIGI